jgi:hypothetical protein
VTNKDPAKYLPIGVQKSYFLLPKAEREILKIEKIENAEAVYTRWIESVQVKGENQDVYLTFSPRFKRVWMQAKKRMPEYVVQKPGKCRNAE